MAGTSNARGFTYEYRICMLCIIRGLNHNYEKFRLQYQVQDAGKFDDFVFDEGGGQYIFVQAKHCEMKSKSEKITHSNYNANFNLLKYVKSVIDINKNPKFRGKIKLAIVFTNLDIVLENDHNVFQISRDSKFYKFDCDENIVQILINQTKHYRNDVGNLTEDEIRDALKYIVYAVNQPNDLKLKEIIKLELNKYDNTQNFVLHCCKYVNQADKKYRPYFIFTSRRKECIPDISTIQLDVFMKKDAENLIKSELGKIKGLVLKHEEVEKLAETLQFFPLAIQQAISFVRIKRKQAIFRTYTLENYMSELKIKSKILLNHEFKERFDKYGMATFSTFDVSLDAITSDPVNGQNAIEILQYMAYLYADEIDVKMFQKYVDKEKLSNVISLLESYSIISLKSDNPYFELGYLQIHRLVQSVVQNKFKEDEKNNIKNVIKIVIPKIVHSEYKKFKTSKDGENEEKWKIEVEHMFFEHESLILHIENLYAHVKKSHGLHQFYRELFDELRKKSFDEIAHHDDVESLKKLNMTQESLKKIAEQNIYYMLHGNHNRLVEYFVTSKLIDIQSVMSKHCLLHFAVSEGNQEMIKLFIGNGANFENDDEYGDKPMHKAAYHGHLETIKYLINRGANCNVKNKDGETPIHYAAVSGQLKIIKFLIENGADFNVEDNKGVTPFYKAAFEGQAQVAKYLIEELGLHFLPPNSINTTNLDKYGNTPLHRAASDGNFEMVKGLIVQKSEDINATNYLGQTALHTAISQGYLNIVKYFFDEMDDFEDMKDYTGGTSIHIAASSGHLNIVEYLVKEKNVYAFSKDKKYNNPLSRAVLEGHFEVVQFLAENKVCIYHNKHSQESSVDIAIFQGHLNIVKLFYEKHNLRGFYENDSLHIAIAKGYVDVIKYLIDKEKWNMYRRDDAKDNTLLHTAALEGQFDIVKYLLSKGADTKLKNRRGEIPLDLAKDTRVKELLMAR
uniref:CSON012826 protein n=1 Tax=Culicoides sonorensis TaxID=179676 RepID=A0A336M6G6_CULSO